MKFLVLGRLPPPIGGVTTSIKNLVNALEMAGETVSFLNISSFWVRYDIAHVHYSKPWKRFIGVILGRLVSKNVFFTVHGNEFKGENIFNRIALALSARVIVLNDDLMLKLTAEGCEKVEQYSSIFIEGMTRDWDCPKKAISVEEKPLLKILVYNAEQSARGGEDIYGIEFFALAMKKFELETRITVVDLSGSYQRTFSTAGVSVEYLDTPVDFIGLLKNTNVYVRCTTKDGDAVAIREALLVGTPVVASDSVPRPKGVHIYKSMCESSFHEALRLASASIPVAGENNGIDSVVRYLQLCRQLTT